MVSIILLTYNNKKEDLFATLKSILMQKDVVFEIIVADDCSDNDWFDDIKTFFNVAGFRDYKLIKNKENKGTVSNLYGSLEYAKYDYIKPISPGDGFIGHKALSDWVENFKNSGKVWSFCDIVRYNITNNKVDIIDKNYYPFDKIVYKQNKCFSTRWNNVVIHDNLVGASIMITNNYLKKYLGIINNKAKLAEDTIYSIMMIDCLTPYYFDKKVVFYSFGSGVSTNKDTKCSEIIKKDHALSRTIMAQHYDNKNFTTKLILNYLMAYYLDQRKLSIFLRVAAKIFYLNYQRHIRNPNNYQSIVSDSAFYKDYINLLFKMP